MQRDDALRRIARLREDIARIDQQILSLVSWRMAVAEEIGDCKRDAALPVRDFRREVEVLEQARRACQSFGLDPELGGALTQVLIEGAVRTQHGIADRPYSGTRRSVLVVGGAGRMGNWLAQYFAGQGHNVSIHDPHAAKSPGFRHARSLRAGVEAAEVVVLATPLEATAGVLDAVTALAPGALVFDICSLKTPLREAVERAHAAGLRVTSVHPMFAPGPSLLSGRVLVVCDCGNPDAAREARGLFEDTALRLVDIPLCDHDRLMAVVLGLSHAVNIAFASTLADSGLTLQELDRVASTTFSKQARTTREVALENPRLYFEIQHRNAYTADVLDALARSVAALKEAALADDPAAFEGIMRHNRSYFEEATGSSEPSP